MGVVSSTYILFKPAKNCIYFFSVQETLATSATNLAFFIGHAYYSHLFIINMFRLHMLELNKGIGRRSKN